MSKYLCRQRRRNLMIFLAAWSCFLVRKEPLVEEKMENSHNTQASPAFIQPLRYPSKEGQGGRAWSWVHGQWAGTGLKGGGGGGVILVAGRQAARGPATVGAVVLLNEHSCSTTLLKSLLFIVASELALDQDGRLGHLLIECKLQGWGGETGAEMEGQRTKPLRVIPPGSVDAGLFLHTLMERLNHHRQHHTRSHA